MKRLAALLPFLASPGFAQCVMCFRTAAAQQAERARVLNLGILLLGAPPFLILAGFCYLVYRRSQTFRDTSEATLHAAMSAGTAPDKVRGIQA